MLIKQTALAAQLKKAILPIYILIGEDNFLAEEAIQSIKSAWKNRHPETETSFFSIEQSKDWGSLQDEANSLSLFSSHTCLDVRFNKKSLDAAGKKMLSDYANDVNAKTLLVIQAPLLSSKVISFCNTYSTCCIVQIISLNAQDMQKWISQALDKQKLFYSPEIVKLIQQYTVGNHLATAQLIYKLALLHQPQETLSIEDVRAHLTDQCDYELFELKEACLQANLSKAIHCTRRAAAQKSEAVLALWILTQEIRLLIQLHQLIQNQKNIHEAAAQLKIWPQSIALYQNALKRLTIAELYTLHSTCQRIDQAFKMGKSKLIWVEIEQVILKICATKAIA